MKKIAYLYVGFFLVGLGIVLSVKSNLGLAPWDVLNQGISRTFDINIGIVNIYVGLAMIVIATFIKVYPGIATVLNAIFCGLFIELLMDHIPHPPNLFIAVIMNILGVVLLALGSALYLKAILGAGPRDSFFLGLVKKLQINITYIRPVVDGIVLLTGFLLGGTIGLGTIVALLFLGFFMDVFFRLLKYNPKEVTQMNFAQQIRYLKEMRNHEDSSS